MLSKKYRQENRGNYKPVCDWHEHGIAMVTALMYSNRLLEVFSVLKTTNALKDTETSHYETLVKQYEDLVQVICDDHVSAAESHVGDERIRNELVEDIKKECLEIVEFRVAAERWKLEIDSRSKDRLVSFGEKLSCRFMAALLQDRVCLLPAVASPNWSLRRW